MIILHFCLANYYIDGYNYQENALTRQNVKDGHETFIIASTRTLINSTYNGYTTTKSYTNEDGVKVIRIPYSKFPFSRYINKYRNYSRLLNEINPDIIFFHGVNSVEVKKIIKYKKKNKHVRLIFDNHAWYGQAGYKTKIGMILRTIYHKTIFKPILQKTLKYIDKFYYVSLECGDYLNQMYNIPKNKIEFYPLGGHIIDETERKRRGYMKRKELNIKFDTKVYLHSGRLTKYKKTIDLLNAFRMNKDEDSILLIAGSLKDDIKSSVLDLINMDERVVFLGWQERESLLNLMCCSDVYVQPGNQSASLQNAICTGCVILANSNKSHHSFIKNNGYFIDSVEDIISAFEIINKDKTILKNMSVVSYEIARELLDYKNIAKKMYI